MTVHPRAFGVPSPRPNPRPPSRPPRPRFARLAVVALLTGFAVAQLGGCAGVKAYQRERLADPIMSFDEDAREESRELHWIEAREASTGGAGVAGGGCACN